MLKQAIGITETLDWYTAMVFKAVMVLDEKELEKTVS